MKVIKKPEEEWKKSNIGMKMLKTLWLPEEVHLMLVEIAKESKTDVRSIIKDALVLYLNKVKWLSKNTIINNNED